MDFLKTLLPLFYNVQSDKESKIFDADKTSVPQYDVRTSVAQQNKLLVDYKSKLIKDMCADPNEMGVITFRYMGNEMFLISASIEQRPAILVSGIMIGCIITIDDRSERWIHSWNTSIKGFRGTSMKKVMLTIPHRKRIKKALRNNEHTNWQGWEYVNEIIHHALHVIPGVEGMMTVPHRNGDGSISNYLFVITQHGITDDEQMLCSPECKRFISLKTGRSCACCKKRVEKRYKCGKCGSAMYCSKWCQIEHWRKHRKTCTKK